MQLSLLEKVKKKVKRKLKKKLKKKVKKKVKKCGDQTSILASTPDGVKKENEEGKRR